MPYEAAQRIQRLALDGNKQPVQYLRLPSLKGKKCEYLHVLHSRKYMGIKYSYNYVKFIKIQYSFKQRLHTLTLKSSFNKVRDRHTRPLYYKFVLSMGSLMLQVQVFHC